MTIVQQAENEKLLKAARHQIFRYGARSLDFKKLAAKVGLGQQAAYKLYHGKSPLVIAAIRDKMQEMDHDLEAIHGKGITFAESMQLMIEVQHKHALEYSQKYIHDILKKGNVEYYDWMCDQRVKVLERHLAWFYKLGLRDGVIRSDMTEGMFSEIYLALTNGVLVGSIMRREKGMDVHEIHRTLFSTLLEGMLLRHGSEHRIAQIKDKRTARESKPAVA